MRNTTILAVAMVIVLLFTPIIYIDGAVVYNNPDCTKFDNLHGGSIKFNIMNNSNSYLEYKVVIYNV